MQERSGAREKKSTEEERVGIPSMYTLLKRKAYVLVWIDPANNQGPVQGKCPKYTTKASVKET